MVNRSRIVNIICAVLSILLAGALIFMLYNENKQEKAQSAAIKAVLEEVQPYEDELQDLKTELSNMKYDVSYSGEEAEIMVGFVASGASDVNYINGKTEAYGFSPVLIIDCTMETDVIEDIIEAADKSWEIMLYAPTFSDEVNEDVLSVISYLEEEGKEHTGVFFLRSDYSTSSYIQLLKDDGFVGYTSYNSESPRAGQTDDGTVYFDYSYLSSSGTSVTSRLSSMYNNKASMMFAFDMSSINEGTLTEDYVAEMLDTLQSYTEKDNCSYSTVAGVVEKLSEINSIESENQESYEEQAAEIQKRIDELEDTISEIYDKLEY